MELGTFRLEDVMKIEGAFSISDDELAGATIRGAFVSALASKLDAEEQRALFASFARPPRFGAFVPFTAYAQSDYHRIVRKVAEKLTPPGASIAEGLRRAAREDFATFGASSFGRVVMAMVGDAKTALVRTPAVYASVAPGPGSVRAEVEGDAHVRVTFDRYPMLWPYQLGQLEGIVGHFGHAPETQVEQLDHGYAYRVRHRA